MKLYVVVEVYQLIVQGVHVTHDEEDAKKHFEQYTGVNYDDYEKDGTNEPLGDFDQTKIFTLRDLDNL